MNIKVTQSIKFTIHCYDDNMVEYRTLFGKWNGRVMSDLVALYDSNGMVIKAFEPNTDVWKKYVLGEVDNTLADYPTVFMSKVITVDIQYPNGTKVATFTIKQ